jgi:hypothetical protein
MTMLSRERFLKKLTAVMMTVISYREAIDGSKSGLGHINREIPADGSC